MRDNRRWSDFIFDTSRGEAIFFFACVALSAAFIEFAPVPRVSTPEPITSCVDGQLAQWDGDDWQIVRIKHSGNAVPCGAYWVRK